MISLEMFPGIGYLANSSRAAMTSLGDIPIAAEFQRLSGVTRYVCTYSGLFTSSAKRASESLASSYSGLSTSNRTDLSDCTINGLLGFAMFLHHPPDTFSIVELSHGKRETAALCGNKPFLHGLNFRLLLSR